MAHIEISITDYRTNGRVTARQGAGDISASIVDERGGRDCFAQVLNFVWPFNLDNELPAVAAEIVQDVTTKIAGKAPIKVSYNGQPAVTADAEDTTTGREYIIIDTVASIKRSIGI